jgi:hypothetical protein
MTHLSREVEGNILFRKKSGVQQVCLKLRARVNCLLKCRLGPFSAFQVAGGDSLRIGGRTLLSLPE